MENPWRPVKIAAPRTHRVVCNGNPLTIDSKHFEGLPSMPNAEKMGLKLAKLWVAKKGDANRLSCYLGIVSLAMKKRILNKSSKQINWNVPRNVFIAQVVVRI